MTSGQRHIIGMYRRVFPLTSCDSGKNVMQVLRAIYEDLSAIESTLAPYDLQEEMEDVITAVYGLSGKEFDADAYIQMVAHLKEICGYSVMNASTTCLMAALLIARYDYPLSKASRLKQTVAQVRNAGYQSRVSPFMAYVLLDDDVADDTLSKSVQIYHEMQEVHGVITGEDDYVPSLYLSGCTSDPKTIAEKVTDNYKNLIKKGFKKGNALQSLAILMTYLASCEDEVLIESAAEVLSQLQSLKIKLNGSQFVLYGLIAFAVEDLPDYLTLLTSEIKRYKEKLGIRRLRTLQKNVIIVETLRQYHRNTGTYPDNVGDWKMERIKGALTLLMLNYLFRERLL